MWAKAKFSGCMCVDGMKIGNGEQDQAGVLGEPRGSGWEARRLC